MLLYFTTNECDETNRVMEHVSQWCVKYVQGMWYTRGYYGSGKYHKWYFQEKADAMLFKLVFGGVYVITSAASESLTYLSDG